MSRPSHAVGVQLVVPFHDCDPLFVAWHGRYLQYLEIARTALMKSRGLDVPDLIALRCRMYVTEARCRYTFPLRYDDAFVVTAWFVPQPPLVKVAYDIYNETKARRAARAFTTLAFTDEDGNLLHEIPAAVRDRLPE